MTFISIIVANSSLYQCPFPQGTLWDGILRLCSPVFTLEPACLPCLHWGGAGH